MNAMSRNGLRLANLLQEQGINDQAVLKAIAMVPREHFVESILGHKAYENTALPIGQGQTISQPYIVARMTELLLQTAPQSVLEIGTGSGYQTAILAALGLKVFSVERIRSLQWQARRRLTQLDLHGVSLRHGDGWQGWQSKGPFDAIIVTAAAAQVPEALKMQLNVGGRLVIPVGEAQQALYIIDRHEDGFSEQVIEAVRFVPLVPGDLA
ncbi:protein-L-isoaspartate(D-aspartate) O-methyltransferase [Neiella sp. HB171785]|uniref:Protein-L-isoaspartate O-methyltransferase n=1 Tax=Neiella litorisoli TaxID=2771431 RepID=A0A8J6UDZ2_9GAMM|nr:protein-L-isoaspartate(D-aspartate) O-methyltransferase [Neiella litorisoli]MBD1388904.1 protein-L-isoaspartate(D-aspartate) O-methyltransferase [Neiella litorisoli]